MSYERQVLPQSFLMEGTTAGMFLQFSIRGFSLFAIRRILLYNAKKDCEVIMEDLLKVGVIASTHGVRGEVKVFPTTDDPKRYLDLDQVILDTGTEQKIMKIERVRFFKNMVILKFEGFETIEDIQIYRQKPLYVTREQAVPLEENEYFIADLIGLLAVTEEGETLGEVVDVIQTGANDIYVIRKDQEPDLLVPAIKDCIKRIDLEEGIVCIHLLKGLRELNQKR